MPTSTRMNRMVQWVVRVAIVACALTTGLALSEAGSVSGETRVQMKTVTGQVSAVNLGFIAVEHERDIEHGRVAEMAFPIDEDSKPALKNTLTSLKLGDTVAVEYKEIAVVSSDGDSGSIRRVATRVSLLASAPAEFAPSSEEMAAGGAQ